MLGLGLQAEQAAGQVEKLAPQFRRRHPAPPPIEQPDAIAGLQRLYLAGQRRLGDVKLLGGPGEAAFAGHRMEGAQLGMIHRLSLCEV